MKIIKIIFSIFSIALLGGAILFFVSQSNAQETESITITPPSIKVTLNPGDTTEGSLGIINGSTTALNFSTNILDFIVTDSNGTPQMLPEGTIHSNKYSAASWIAVAPTQFSIKQHDRFDFHYYIKVPINATPGGHYAAILYSPTPLGQAQASGASIQTQIATLVYITVTGTIKEQAKVTKFTAPSFSEYGPVQISSQITNLGDSHITPLGEIQIKDIFGRIIASSPLDEKNIFPGDIARNYTNTLGTKIMIGPFTASLIASYGSKNNLPLTATLTFWVFPWKASAIVVAVLLAIILGLAYWKKKRKQEDDMLSSFDPKSLS